MNNETEITPGTEEIVPETPVETPAATGHPAAPPAPVELRFEYQPTDEQGRPIGGKQVIVYTDTADLSAKLVEQNTLLLRKLRSETRKNRLGITEDENIEEQAPRFAEPTELRPKELSEDDKIALALKLGVSPEDFDAATDELFETKFGLKPSALSAKLLKLEEKEAAREAVAEAEAFKRSNSDYYVCPENSQAIAGWMARYNLAFVRANYQRAFDTLRAAGILIECPVTAPASGPPVSAPELVVEEIPPAPEPETPAPPKPISRVPVSLSRTNTDETGASPVTTPGSDIIYDVVQNGVKRRFTGLAAINAMPSDEYRRRTLSDPSFAKKEAALEKDLATRRSRRG